MQFSSASVTLIVLFPVLRLQSQHAVPDKLQISQSFRGAILSMMHMKRDDDRAESTSFETRHTIEMDDYWVELTR